MKPLTRLTRPEHNTTAWRRFRLVGALTAAGLSFSSTVLAAETFSLARWAADPLETAALYHNPVKPFLELVYPEVHATGSGAAGLNIAFESGQSPKWYVEEQRGGADLVEAGVAQGNSEWIDLGVRVLDWGFARQNASGGWDCPDTFHSATFFVEAAARAGLCLKRAALPKYQAKLGEWVAHLRAAGSWMNQRTVLDSDPFFYQYTHRSYLAAAALAETAELTGDKGPASTAERMVRTAISFQWPNGVNPEKGGYDVGYQVAGLNYALRFYDVCAAPDLRAPLARMILRGTDFELTKMDAHGIVTTEGSTRLGHETNRSGAPKVIGYKPILQTLVGAALLSTDHKYRDAATSIARGQGWLPPSP